MEASILDLLSGALLLCVLLALVLSFGSAHVNGALLAPLGRGSRRGRKAFESVGGSCCLAAGALIWGFTELRSTVTEPVE